MHPALLLASDDRGSPGLGSAGFGRNVAELVLNRTWRRAFVTLNTRGPPRVRVVVGGVWRAPGEWLRRAWILTLYLRPSQHPAASTAP